MKLRRNRKIPTLPAAAASCDQPAAANFFSGIHPRAVAFAQRLHRNPVSDGCQYR
jgi:hypothetical protein